MTHSPIADVSEKLTRMKAVDAPLLKKVADAIDRGILKAPVVGDIIYK